MGASVDTNGDIWFENVRVPKENRAQADPEDDVKSVLANIAIGRLTSAAFPLGVMKRAYEVIKEYVDHREIAGKPMKEHGVIVHELGQIASDILNAEGYLYYVAARMDHPDVYGFPWEMKNIAIVSACQNTVSNLGWSVVESCLGSDGVPWLFKRRKNRKLLRDNENYTNSGRGADAPLNRTCKVLFRDGDHLMEGPFIGPSHGSVRKWH